MLSDTHEMGRGRQGHDNESVTLTFNTDTMSEVVDASNLNTILSVKLPKMKLYSRGANCGASHQPPTQISMKKKSTNSLPLIIPLQLCLWSLEEPMPPPILVQSSATAAPVVPAKWYKQKRQKMLRTDSWYVSECFVASGLPTVRIWNRANAGCHSWNPLTCLLSLFVPLTEG